MAKVILYAHVLPDGTGDFKHLLDLVCHYHKTLKDKFEFIPVFTFDNKVHQAEFEGKLKAAGIDPYYSSVSSDIVKNFSENESLKKHLAKADQFVQVSSNIDMLYQHSLEELVNPKAVRKFIGEHEANGEYTDIEKVFSMGLSHDVYGIK